MRTRNVVGRRPTACADSAAALLRITLGALNARPQFRLGHVEPLGRERGAGTEAITDSYRLASAIERCLGQPVLSWLNARELATVLAGLRALQHRDGREPGNPSDALRSVATDIGSLPALSVDEIDALCERLNAAE